MVYEAAVINNEKFIAFKEAYAESAGGNGAAGGKAKETISLYHKSEKRIVYLGAMV